MASVSLRLLLVSTTAAAAMFCAAQAQAPRQAGQAAADARAGAASIVGSVRQSNASLASAVAALQIEPMHLPEAEKNALRESRSSITRNLQQAVPGLLDRFQAEPENLGAAFRLYRDLEAVLLVAQRSADTMPASADGAAELQASTQGLRASLSQLGDWIEARGNTEFARLQQARSAPPAARPGAHQPPPPTLIINDANTSSQRKSR